jgi:TATA-binding protein-associated factor
MEKGTLLLGSSGKEFKKPTGILRSASEVKKARREAMGRLGLDFLESFGGNDEMDLDKELAADTEVDPEGDAGIPTAVKVEETANPLSPTHPQGDIKFKKEPSPVVPPPQQASKPPDELDGLSARERNRLKRKRKPGSSAYVAAPPIQISGSRYNAAPAAQPTK